MALADTRLATRWAAAEARGSPPYRVCAGAAGGNQEL